jgi:hypothetical protein
MTAWAGEDLDRIGESEELQIASLRPDGTLRPYVIIWVVRVGEELYVRSALGPQNPWFRRAKEAGAGRVLASGVERDATFAAAEEFPHEAIDAAYRKKYSSHPREDVDAVVGESSWRATLRLLPPSSGGS